MAIIEDNLSMLEEAYDGTVLHLTTQLGFEVHAKKMIELRTALISSANSKGDTPLHLAASLGHTSRAGPSIALHTASETKALEVPKLAEMMNNDGLTPLHCAAMNGSVEILRVFLDKFPSLFYSVTLAKKETVFHSDKLGQLLYQLDVEGNTVLHAAASVGSIAETEVKVTTKNKKGFVAVDLLNKDDGDFLQLFTALMMCDLEIVIERPPSPREMGNFDSQEVDDLKLQKEIVRVKSSPNKKFEMQLEALQSARNTLTIVAVLIASVTFTCGINPPGGVYQEEHSIGKSTAARTLAFMIFKISNSIVLFTSVSMVVLLVCIIPYNEDSLLKFLVIAHRMMWVAVGAMASAYVSATSVILPNFRETKCLTLGVMFVYLHFKLAKYQIRKGHLLDHLTIPPVRKD
ncbi:hypothetical protein EUTSA_v10015255mg, partial [Eutrema salsugineum]